MFVSMISEKIKETTPKFTTDSVTVLQKMRKYEEARVKITNKQLNKYKYATKYKAGTTLRTTQKNIQSEELPHKLSLTRQKNKSKNAFANNMSIDVKRLM